MMQKGSVFLIPTYLSDKNDASFIAPVVLEVIRNTTCFLVENVRTTRRYISSLQLGVDLAKLHFEVLDKNSDPSKLEQLFGPVHAGKDIGIVSEAGLPGLADPGNLAVSYAHKHKIRVIPLPGASSIQTALTASGFNGQQFVFHGYLPIDQGQRIAAIKKMEADLRKTGYTQIFMETPYRNMKLLKDLCQHCAPAILLSVAADVTGSQEFIRTQPVSEWKKEKTDLHKIPAVFCLGHYPA